MAGESKKDHKEIGEIAGDVPATSKATEEKKRKKKRGVMSRMWNGLFRLHGDDFEKRLQYISKEEATVLARMKKRSSSWRRMTKHLIIFSVLFEIELVYMLVVIITLNWLESVVRQKWGLTFLRLLIFVPEGPDSRINATCLYHLQVIAVGYAIMTTRSLDLNWQKRALRVLPMFLLPALSSLTYSAFLSFTKMCDRKDQKTLERLRTERQEKINELKEKTNYYSTQQLIQRYDPDPAAKAAAATVLASKLGADSGLKVFMGDDTKFNPLTGKSNEAEFVQSSGLRKRKQSHYRSSSTESAVLHHSEEEMMQYAEPEGLEMSKQDQLVVEHQIPTGLHAQDGGWIARIAALLVGEDPTQSYALICGNCHMHNGLARKEDFPYITYYCPHCNALNRPKQVEGHASDSSSSNMSASLVSSPNVSASMVSSPNVSASMVSSPNAGSSTVSSLSTGTSMVNSPVVGPATPVDDASTVLNTSESMSDDEASNSSWPVAAAVEHKEGSEKILSESSVS